MHAKSLQSCLTLCNPTAACSLAGSSVHGILQARILEWVAMPSSRGSSPPRDGTQSSALVGWFFTTRTTWEGPATAAAANFASVVSDSVQPLLAAHQAPHPWDSPGKNTGVNCHFLLQCMKVKSQSEVTQSCLTLWEGPRIDSEKAMAPTPVLLPGKSHGQRSLVGCSPSGHEESDMTEGLHFHFSLVCTGEGNGNPLQCSCLENPRDGVAQSRTLLK